MAADGRQQPAQPQALPAPRARPWQRPARRQHAPQGAGRHADGERVPDAHAQARHGRHPQLRRQHRRIRAERLNERNPNAEGRHMTVGSREFTSPTRARVRRLAAVVCAAVLLAGAASGPGDPKTSTVPPSPVVANAAMEGDTAALRKLVACGANVNVAQGDGMTALHWADERGDVSMANLLFRAHASLKAATRNGGYTPLHVASKDGNAAVVRALIKAGSDVNAMTATGATALHLAAASGSADAVTALL